MFYGSDESGCPPLGFLARADLCRVTEEYPKAPKDPASTRERLELARTLVNETGYHRRDKDLKEIEAALSA